jgi:hypothetical protein
MLEDGVLTEAHALMATRALASAPAIGAAADPVARLWCRSFGVADEDGVERLRNLLTSAAIDMVSAGGSLDALPERLDGVAESAIRDWIGRMLGRAVAPTLQALAIVRLAFLEANQDGRWSRWFLADDAPAAELAADLEAVMIEPTPAHRPRRMERQEI